MTKITPFWPQKQPIYQLYRLNGKRYFLKINSLEWVYCFRRQQELEGHLHIMESTYV